METYQVPRPPRFSKRSVVVELSNFIIVAIPRPRSSVALATLMRDAMTSAQREIQTRNFICSEIRKVSGKGKG